MYKRPSWHPHGCYTISPPVAPGHPSVVGKIIDAMHNNHASLVPPEKPWTAHINYEFIARHLPLDEQEAYIKKSIEWFEAHAPATPAPATPRVTFDNSFLVETLQKYTGTRPHVKEMVKAMRLGGYPEERIDKYVKWCKRMEDTVDERQEVIDKIFAKYPSASKPDPKPKIKKVIKAVKKRMNNEQAS